MQPETRNQVRALCQRIRRDAMLTAPATTKQVSAVTVKPRIQEGVAGRAHHAVLPRGLELHDTLAGPLGSLEIIHVGGG